MVDAARIGGSTPSYLHGLSLIGQYFNQEHARLVTIAEVDTGFLLYFFPGGNWRKPRIVPIHHTEVLELSGPFAGGSSNTRNGAVLRGSETKDRKHPLFPMGYAPFLRALGHKLDRRKATGLTICETADKIYVNYWLDKATFVIRDQRRQAVSNIQIEIYDAAGVTKLIAGTQQTLEQEAMRYEQGMKLNPHDHITAMQAAFLLEDEGNYRDAESLFGRVVSQVPEHPEAHYHIARLALTRGDRGSAMAAIKRALRIRPDLAAIHDLHGRVLRRQNKQKEAAAAFQEATTIDPDNGIYHYHLAKAYEALGRKEDAAAEMAVTTSQHAAPAWDMLQEEIASDMRPAAPPRLAELASQSVHDSPAASALLPSISDSPAAAALLPPLPKEDQAGQVAAVFHADWGATVARSERQEPVSGQAEGQAAPRPASESLAAPRMTPFETTPATWSPPPPQEPAVPSWPSTPPPASDFPNAATGWPAPPLVSASPVETRPDTRVSAPDAPAWPPTAAPRDMSPEQASMTLEQRLWTTGQPPSQAPMQEPPVHAPSAAAATPTTPAAAAAASIMHTLSQPARPAQISESANNQGAVEIAAEIMMIQKGLEAEPNRADLHRKLGFLLARQGRTAEAATEFRKALQCSRTSL